MPAIQVKTREEVDKERRPPESVAYEDNTSLFIAGLPKNVTHKALFAAIRNCGGIRHCELLPPTGKHETAAARIRFWRRNAGSELVRQAKAGLFFLHKVRPKVHFNSIPTSQEVPEGRSRVLLITGPPDFVNRESIEEFLATKMSNWDVDRVLSPTYCCCGEYSSLTYYFGSWDGQAEVAYRELRAIRGLKDMWVKYDEDPCGCDDEEEY